ncbi:MAG TPA: four helix bundle protein [Flavisolibacter sp.]
MAGDFANKVLELNTLSRKLVPDCYELTGSLPGEEKTSLPGMIRSAAMAAYINIAQVASGGPVKKRRQHIRTAKRALIVLNAATAVLAEVKLADGERCHETTRLSSMCYEMLDGLKKRKSSD